MRYIEQLIIYAIYWREFNPEKAQKLFEAGLFAASCIFWLVVLGVVKFILDLYFFTNLTT